MRNINLNNISNDLATPDARLVATAGFKWLVKGHMKYLDDANDMKLIAKDYLDFIKLAQMIEALDTQRDWRSIDINRATKKIFAAIQQIESGPDGEIPGKVYERFRRASGA